MNINLDWIAIGVIVSAILTWATIYGTIISPRRKEREELERERLERRRAVDNWIDGGKQLDGTVITGAPEKLHDVELATRENTRVLLGVSAGQSLLEKRMDEANGTARRTEKSVTEIHTMIQEIVHAGADVKMNLDLDATKLATLTDESKTELLDAIHETKGTP